MSQERGLGHPRPAWLASLGTAHVSEGRATRKAATSAR